MCPRGAPRHPWASRRLRPSRRLKHRGRPARPWATFRWADSAARKVLPVPHGACEQANRIYSVILGNWLNLLLPPHRSASKNGWEHLQYPKDTVFLVSQTKTAGDCTPGVSILHRVFRVRMDLFGGYRQPWYELCQSFWRQRLLSVLHWNLSHFFCLLQFLDKLFCLRGNAIILSQFCLKIAVNETGCFGRDDGYANRTSFYLYWSMSYLFVLNRLAHSNAACKPMRIWGEIG